MLIHGDLAPHSNSTGKRSQLSRVLLTSLVLSAGGQDTHFSFKAATVILECAFLSPATSNTLGQYNHCCSYGMNQIRKFSQVKTSHLFLT